MSISERQFFLRASALPVAIPALAGVLVGCLRVAPPAIREQLSALDGLSTTLLLIGVWSVIPYALYMAIVWFAWRPSSTRGWLLAVGGGSVVPAGLLLAFLLMVARARSRPPTTALFWSTLAVEVGCCYAALIGIWFGIARARGSVSSRE